MDGFALVTADGEALFQTVGFHISEYKRARVEDCGNVGVIPHCCIRQKFVEFEVASQNVFLVGVWNFSVPCLYVIVTLRGLSDILTAYLSSISSATVSSNYATMKMILHELLCTPLPSTLEKNVLLGAVRQHSSPTDALDAVSKMAKSLALSGDSIQFTYGTGSGSGAGSGLLGSGSRVWWRRLETPDVEEVFIDIQEEISGVRTTGDKDVNLLVCGSIAVKAQLSHQPELTIGIQFPDSGCIETPSLWYHTCVSKTSATDGLMSATFVPPNSQFTLVGYSLKPNNFKPPIDLRYSQSFGSNFWRISLSACLSSQAGRPNTGSASKTNIESVQVDLFLGADVEVVSTPALAAGTWKWIRRDGVFHWDIEAISHTRNVVEFEIRPLQHYIKPIATVRFVMESFSFSGVKIESLERRANTSPFYKGFRRKSTGSVEWHF